MISRYIDIKHSVYVCPKSIFSSFLAIQFSAKLKVRYISFKITGFVKFKSTFPCIYSSMEYEGLVNVIVKNRLVVEVDMLMILIT